MIVDVATTEDNVVEAEEVFRAVLTNPSQGLTVAGGEATVNIADDDGMLQMYPTITFLCITLSFFLLNAVLLVEFDPVAYNVREDQPMVTLNIVLSSPAVQDVSVDIQTNDGSALGM